MSTFKLTQKYTWIFTSLIGRGYVTKDQELSRGMYNVLLINGEKSVNLSIKEEIEGVGFKVPKLLEVFLLHNSKNINIVEETSIDEVLNWLDIELTKS